MVFPDTHFPFSGKLREKCPNTDTVRTVESTEMKVNISINFVKLLMFNQSLPISIRKGIYIFKGVIITRKVYFEQRTTPKMKLYSALVQILRRLDKGILILVFIQILHLSSHILINTVL